MSASPETPTDDRIVSLLSHWLAGHVDDDELRVQVDEIGTAGLTGDQREAVGELCEALEGNHSGELEVAVRETLETLALGL